MRKVWGSNSFYCPYGGCVAGKGSLLSVRFLRKGYYRRSSDSQIVSRFICPHCKRSFSSARFTPSFGQKKRNLNDPLWKLLCSEVTQRRCARLLRINLKTVARKFRYLSSLAHQANHEFLEAWFEEKGPITRIQFDEMQSFEISSLLPVSIPIAVTGTGDRKVLGFEVASMPATGKISDISIKKYGPRLDERANKGKGVLQSLKPYLAKDVTIVSDKNPNYGGWIKEQLPEATHIQVKGRRGCVVGFGELKEGGFDPLFEFNHTAAMFRANISRLMRRTWCTTKKKKSLADHIALYIRYHNEILTP